MSSSGRPPARRPAIKAYLQLIAVTIARLLGKDRNRAISSARDVQTVIRSRELVEQRYRDHPSLDYWRGERYIRGGADGLFIEAPVDVDELERIGRTFDVPQLAIMLEGGRTLFLTPVELEQPGFRIVIHGISLLMHAVQAMENVLTGLAHSKVDFAGKGVGFEN